MCRSDGLIGLNSTRTSASPGANSGVGISASFITLFGSPVSRKINAFIDTFRIFKQETEILNADWRRYTVTACFKVLAPVYNVSACLPCVDTRLYTTSPGSSDAGRTAAAALAGQHIC